MFPVDKKNRGEKKVEDKYVLIPWYPISYLTIASYGFFWGGRLRVPTRRCDLVVPAEWGWGRSNKPIGASPHHDYLVKRMVLVEIEGVGIYQKRGGKLRGLRIK